MNAWIRRLVIVALSAAAGEIGWRLYDDAGVMTVDPRLRPHLGMWTLAVYLVALAATTLASDVAARLQASETRCDRGPLLRDAVGIVAINWVVRGLTAGLPFERGASTMATVTSISILGWVLFDGRRSGLIVGFAGAALGFLGEALVAGGGWNHYATPLQHVAGVPVWIPSVYFAFGVAVSQCTRTVDAGFPRES